MASAEPTWIEEGKDHVAVVGGRDVGRLTRYTMGAREWVWVARDFDNGELTGHRSPARAKGWVRDWLAAGRCE